MNALPLGWHVARFDEILKRVERKTQVDEATTYNCVGVRWYGLGAFIREVELGMNIARKQQWIIKEGDIVYNKLFAWKGAFAVAAHQVDGCIVSDKFPTYEANASLVDSDYLRYYFRTNLPAQQAVGMSKGAAAISKLTLNPPQFWDLQIPLPPLNEQHRVVARIEALAAKIEEARRLRRAATAETDAFADSSLNTIFGEVFKHQWPAVSLDAIADIRSGVTLGRNLAGPTIRLPYLRVANVQDGYLDLRQVKEIDVLQTECDKWQLRSGDILLTEGGDWDKLGRGTVWRGEIPNCIHQNHIFRLRVNPNDFEPTYLALLIGSPFGKAYFQAASKQTTNLASINQRQLRKFQVFKPPLAEQRRIVAQLDSQQACLDALKRLQAETAAELDALLPSVLDRAFRGEL